MTTLATPKLIDFGGAPTYAWLRAYRGPAKGFYLGGRTNYSDGAHGVFVRTGTKSDNDGTVLVDTLGRSWERVIDGHVDVRWFGADPAKTNAENKTALQAAIFAVDSMGGGVLYVDYGICYGYKVGDPTTYPSFSGISNPIVIHDYSRGTSYAGYPTAYDGAQCRAWMYTPQTTSAGQHDGNTQWLRGGWAPAYLISNDSNLAPVGNPSRTSDDNRRASIFFANDGIVTWRIGQGAKTGAAFTDDQLSDFTLAAFGNYGGGTVDGTSALLIERQTGNFGFNTDPVSSYHFKSKTTGFDQATFESLGLTSKVRLKNSAADEVELYNDTGSFKVAVGGSSQIELNKTTKYFGLGTSPAFKHHIVDSRDGNFVQSVENNSTSSGYVQKLITATAPSSGFSFLEAFSSGGADRAFKLAGDGNGYADGAWTGGGADYAEYFEWVDGNPTGEDRRGVSVALVGNKIKPASAGDDVIGVVSANPSVIGDSAWNHWNGKYLRDEFGGWLLDSDGLRQINPDYNPDAEYIPREQRQEWACIGLVGKLRVRNGQQVGPRWIKMRDISPTVSEYFVR